MSQKKILAGDIGGSHFTLALFEEKGTELNLLQTERHVLDSKLPKEEILQQWVLSLKKYTKGNPGLCISLAMPAPFDYEKGVCWIKEQGKFNSLFGCDLKTEFSQGLGIPHSQIKFINDAEAFLFGEAHFGKGFGFTNLLGITLGSGLGSAIKQGDILFDADLWQSPLKGGIAEDYLGTGWFLKLVKNKFGLELKGVKDLLDHETLQPEIPVIFDIYAKNLSEFILSVYAKVPFEAVIIGGNISLSSSLFVPKLLEHLRDATADIVIEISQLGELSTIYGATSLFFEARSERASN